MINKYNEDTNGRTVIMEVCPILLPKRILFRTQHKAHAKVQVKYTLYYTAARALPWMLAPIFLTPFVGHQPGCVLPRWPNCRVCARSVSIGGGRGTRDRMRSFDGIVNLVSEMSCEVKRRLLDVYQEVVAHYSITVGDVAAARGKTLKQDYDRLQALADVAKDAAEAARLALARHAKEHGC